MGADSSKGAVRKSVFTNGEREKLDRLFRKISGDGTDSFSLKQFKVGVAVVHATKRRVCIDSQSINMFKPGI